MKSSSEVHEASYFCALCNENRYVDIDRSIFRQQIESGSSGLIEISDIHYCHNGFLSINNLHLDKNFHVRSFSLMELPDKKRKTISIPGIPVPSRKQAEFSTYKITKMIPEGGYRLKIIDHTLRINLNIGEIKKSEDYIDMIRSSNEDVLLFYYDCDIALRKHNREWFKVLVDSLETQPPTRLGLFLEALRYVYQQNDVKPGYFEIEQLKTLLTSHKTKFELLPHNYKAIRNITNKYGKEKREVIDRLIQALKNNPDATLHQVQMHLSVDLVYLIFLAIILETEGVLRIIRAKNLT